MSIAASIAGYGNRLPPDAAHVYGRSLIGFPIGVLKSVAAAEKRGSMITDFMVNASISDRATSQQNFTAVWLTQQR